jgi:hypothetical protein
MAKEAGPVCRVQFACGLGDQQFHRLADEFLPVVAEQPLDFAINQHDTALFVDDEHAGRGAIYRQAKQVARGIGHWVGHNTAPRPKAVPHYACNWLRWRCFHLISASDRERGTSYA